MCVREKTRANWTVEKIGKTRRMRDIYVSSAPLGAENFFLRSAWPWDFYGQNNAPGEIFYGHGQHVGITGQ